MFQFIEEMKNFEYLEMMKQYDYGNNNLQKFELRLRLVIMLKLYECNEEKYFIITKKKIGGVEHEFLIICLFENLVDQILRCFGIFEQN
jgi:hypothetical protein